MAAALAQGIISGAICWRWDRHWGRHPPHHRSHPPPQGMVHDTDILRQTREQRWLPEPGHLGEQWIMALAVALGLELTQHSWTLSLSTCGSVGSVRLRVGCLNIIKYRSRNCNTASCIC